MNIGQAAKASGVSAKMIRYYEGTGLIRKAARSQAGYRHYGENDIHTLRFIRRGRDLGFTVEQIAGLLELWRDQSRASADVKRLARGHLAALNGKIAELQAMARALGTLVAHCDGNDRPDCPIIEDLAEAATDGDFAPRHGVGSHRFGGPGARLARRKREAAASIAGGS
jgi:MerR family copper efflux transcriptional regulator